MENKQKQVHFIGIAGSGLSAIARILHERGYFVTGSDQVNSSIAQELGKLGIPVVIGHRAENIQGANLIIRSSAIPDTNVEVQAALKEGIPVLKRKDFLRQITADQPTIAVAGTHGKTTTTAMVAWVFSQLGFDPSFIIGGIALDLKSNAHAGKGQYFVIEADEYDGMFLGLNPYAAIITNVEHDHPDCYPTEESFEEAFIRFSSQVDPQGVILGCFEDRGVREVFQSSASKATLIKYGLWGKGQYESFDYAAKIRSIDKTGAFDFEVIYLQNAIAQIQLKIPGEHNVYNALAVTGLCHWMGLPIDKVSQALGEFHGVGRRFEKRGRVGSLVLIDDYAHHPSEIRATISAAKVSFPNQFIWVVWQPHTYSRTISFWKKYQEAFQEADGLIVLDVYAARENPPQNFSMEKLIAEIQHPNKTFCPNLKEAHHFLMNNLKENAVVLVLSAGDANQLNDMLMETLPTQNLALG